MKFVSYETQQQSVYKYYLAFGSVEKVRNLKSASLIWGEGFWGWQGRAFDRKSNSVGTSDSRRDFQQSHSLLKV
jgi:hypothetical protein